MAFTGGWATYSNTDANRPDVQGMISVVSREESPFLDLIGEGAAARALTISWLQDTINAESTTMNDAGGISSGDTSMTVTDGSIFKVYDILQIEQELVQVTAVATNTLTITRAYGGTTAAAHADGLTVELISHINEEGADVTDFKSPSRSLVSNYCQSVEPFAMNLSDEEIIIAKYGDIDELGRQRLLATISAVTEIEKSAIRGRARSTTKAGGDGVPATMDGLKYFCSTNNVAVGGALSETVMENNLIAFHDNGMKRPDFILCNAKQRNVINGFAQTATVDQHQYDAASDKVINRRVIKYNPGIFPGDGMTVIQSPWMDTDEVIVGTSEHLGMRTLVPLHFKRLAESGHSEKYAPKWSGAIEVKQENQHGRFSGLT